MSWQSVAHLQWHPFIGFSLHPGLLAAPIPVPVPRLPHLSFSVLNGIPIPYGSGMVGVGGLGSLPANVRGQMITGSGGIPLMGRTSDAGFIVPHVSYPPTNYLLPLTILFGGSDSLAGSSQVRITCYKGLLQRIGDSSTSEQFDTAACVFPTVPISLNFGCFEPLLAPLDVVIAPNTVMVGMSAADLLNMAIDFALAAAVEVLMGAGGAALGKAAKKARKLKASRAAKKGMKKAAEAAAEAQEKSLRRASGTLREALAIRRAKVTARPKRTVGRAIRKGKVRRARHAGDAAFKKSIREQFGDPDLVRKKLLDDHKLVTDAFSRKPAWVRRAVEKAYWQNVLGGVGAAEVAGAVVDNRLRPFLRKGTREAFKSITKKLGQETTQDEVNDSRRGARGQPARTSPGTPQSAQIAEGEEIMRALGIPVPAGGP